MGERRAARARPARCGIAAAVLAAILVAVGAPHAGAQPGRAATRPGPSDWPSYGHDAQHTFHGRTSLTPASVSSLHQAWFFPTGDAVTATPTVAAGTVYAGSWDGRFYALDLATGTPRWQFQLSAQNAVTPNATEIVRDATSDGGLVTSSAWYEPGAGRRPDLVIFGGGYTLYALNAHTGALYWRHDYTGQPALPPNPDHDGARIFSSPVVADGKVLFGLSVDGQRGERGYLAAASLQTGAPVWVAETDVDEHGVVLNNGCGNVWSSGSVLPKEHLVVFDEADCHFRNPPPTAESVFAVRIADGHLVWRYQPHRPDNQCDWDFGASVNVGLASDGHATFAGVGGKDGTYTSLDPTTGRVRWRTNVVFGGFSGGFIGTAAYDGRTVLSATAIGDFGRFESNGPQVCAPGDPRDQKMQEPSVHALDAQHGGVRWQATGAASFGPTTVAGGMTFNGLALSDQVQVRDAASGHLLDTITLPSPCWGGIATVGDALVFGTGASEIGSPDGVYAYTPAGRAPSARP